MVGGSIYDTQSSIKTIRTTLVYYIEKDKWYEGPDLNEARHGHSCCTLGGTLFAIGGFAHGGPIIIDNIEQYHFVICALI